MKHITFNVFSCLLFSDSETPSESLWLWLSPAVLRLIFSFSIHTHTHTHIVTVIVYYTQLAPACVKAFFPWFVCLFVVIKHYKWHNRDTLQTPVHEPTLEKCVMWWCHDYLYVSRLFFSLSIHMYTYTYTYCYYYCVLYKKLAPAWVKAFFPFLVSFFVVIKPEILTSDDTIVTLYRHPSTNRF